jgi:hypothetical protein
LKAQWTKSLEEASRLQNMANVFTELMAKSLNDQTRLSHGFTNTFSPFTRTSMSIAVQQQESKPKDWHTLCSQDWSD